MSILSTGEALQQHYGLEIPKMDSRQAIADILKSAYREWAGGFRSDSTESANNVTDQIRRLPGIAILEYGKYGADYDYGCAHFVFGTVHRQPWARPYRELAREMFLPTDSSKFLFSFIKKAGDYALVDDPCAGNVAAYSVQKMSPEQDLIFTHFGIVQPDGSITSKLSIGPVVNHPIEVVHPSYGNYVYFLGHSAINKLAA